LDGADPLPGAARLAGPPVAVRFVAPDRLAVFDRGGGLVVWDLREKRRVPAGPPVGPSGATDPPAAVSGAFGGRVLVAAAGSIQAVALATGKPAGPPVPLPDPRATPVAVAADALGKRAAVVCKRPGEAGFAVAVLDLRSGHGAAYVALPAGAGPAGRELHRGGDSGAGGDRRRRRRGALRRGGAGAGRLPAGGGRPGGAVPRPGGRPALVGGARPGRWQAGGAGRGRDAVRGLLRGGGPGRGGQAAGVPGAASGRAGKVGDSPARGGPGRVRTGRRELVTRGARDLFQAHGDGRDLVIGLRLDGEPQLRGLPVGVLAAEQVLRGRAERRLPRLRPGDRHHVLAGRRPVPGGVGGQPVLAAVVGRPGRRLDVVPRRGDRVEHHRRPGGRPPLLVHHLAMDRVDLHTAVPAGRQGRGQHRHCNRPGGPGESRSHRRPPGQLSETASPPLYVTWAARVRIEIEAVTNRTDPSAISTFAPPEWKLYSP